MQKTDIASIALQMPMQRPGRDRAGLLVSGIGRASAAVTLEGAEAAGVQQIWKRRS